MALASSKLNEKHSFRRSAVLQLRFNSLNGGDDRSTEIFPTFATKL